MSNFWLALFAAQTAAADAKPTDRRHRVLSVLGGIALALLIGSGLLLAVALTRSHADAHSGSSVAPDLYGATVFL